MVISNGKWYEWNGDLIAWLPWHIREFGTQAWFHVSWIGPCTCLLGETNVIKSARFISFHERSRVDMAVVLHRTSWPHKSWIPTILPATPGRLLLRWLFMAFFSARFSNSSSFSLALVIGRGSISPNYGGWTWRNAEFIEQNWCSLFNHTARFVVILNIGLK